MNSPYFNCRALACTTRSTTRRRSPVRRRGTGIARRREGPSGALSRALPILSGRARRRPPGRLQRGALRRRLHRAPRRPGRRDLPDRQRVDRRDRRDRGALPRPRPRRDRDFPARRRVLRGSRCSRARAELAATLDADWFLHVDADEIRLPPRSRHDARGGARRGRPAGLQRGQLPRVHVRPDASSIPTTTTRASRRRCAATTRSCPAFPDRLNAWKRQEQPVDLVTSGGHVVDFPGLRMYPESFPMRHYLFLSVEHAIRKYVERVVRPDRGRGGLAPAAGRASRRGHHAPVREPSCAQYVSDDLLDPSDPWTRAPALRRTPSRARRERPRRTGRSSSAAAIARARASCGGSSTRTRGSTAGPRSRSSATSTATSGTTRSRTCASRERSATSSPRTRRWTSSAAPSSSCTSAPRDARARRAGRTRRPENVLYADASGSACSKSRFLFVHVVRNPLDTVASMEGRFPLTLPRGVEEGRAATARTRRRVSRSGRRDPDRCAAGRVRGALRRRPPRSSTR